MFNDAIQTYNLTLFRMGIFGAAHGWGRWESPLSVITSHTYSTMIKIDSYTLLKENAKNKRIVRRIFQTLLTSAFFIGRQQILLYQEIQI